MPKKKIEHEILSWGLYEGWDPGSKDLPRICEFSTSVPARVGVEFGFIIRIRGGRGKQLHFRIDHPPFSGKDGDTAPPFADTVYIRSTPYDFFLGDTIWEPVADKVGVWTLQLWIGDDPEPVASKTFTVVPSP